MRNAISRRTFIKATGYAGCLLIIGCGGGSSGSNTSANILASSPVFTLQPLSQIVKSGDSVTFSVQVEGTPNPDLQWQLDGVDIPGATGNLYTTSPLTLNDSNSAYTVIASNSEGTLSSAAAIVQVLPSALTADSTLISVDSASVVVN